MMRGKIYFSNAEETIIAELCKVFGCTELVAIEQVISQKRELIFIHAQRGNMELVKQLKKEIGEE